MSSDLHVRQRGLLAPELHSTIVFIAGVGMLGSHTALAVARMADEVIVFDPDRVEDVNFGTQAYNQRHEGMSKVDAIADLAMGLPLSGVLGRFPLEKSPEDILQEVLDDIDFPTKVLISGVDSFKARRELAQWALQHEIDLFLDTRAQGELIVTYTVPYEKLHEYISGLERDEDAPATICGTEGTAYSGMYVAARTASALNNYLRGMPCQYLHVEHLGAGIVYQHVPLVSEGGGNAA